MILLEHTSLRTLALLTITIWPFCRFYYFLFYVLEHLIGRTQKYTGVLDAMAYLIKLKNPISNHKPPPDV